MPDDKQLPSDPKAMSDWIRHRVDGHSPGYDIAVYARPAIWRALADVLDAVEPLRMELRAMRQDDGAVIAGLQGEIRQLRAELAEWQEH